MTKAKVGSMTWTVTIGPGLPGDEAKLNDHLTRCGLPSVAEEIGASRFLVAKNSGVIVGCGALQSVGVDAILRSLAVSPNFQRRGLGRQLLGELIDRALRLQLGTIFLLTVDQSSFFRRMGFRQQNRDETPILIAETEHFRSTCCEEAVLMSFVFPKPGVES